MSVPVLGVVHCNVNCASLARSTAFYTQVLGLRALAHTAPEKPQDGRGFGLAGPAQWDAHILHDARGPAAVGLDLLEWKVPRPIGQPPREPSQLGFARLCLAHPDLEPLARRVEAAAAEVRWGRGTGPDREAARRLEVRDPDGTLLELREGGEHGPLLERVVVNCSSLGRSTDWYLRVLDLDPLGALQVDALEVEQIGGSAELSWRRQALCVAGQPEDFGIELREWTRPGPVGHPPRAANQLGIFRMAFLVDDARASYEQLRTAGIECPEPVWLEMGPEIPVDGLWAVFFPDPDGSCLELIQRPQPA